MHSASVSFMRAKCDIGRPIATLSLPCKILLGLLVNQHLLRWLLEAAVLRADGQRRAAGCLLLGLGQHLGSQLRLLITVSNPLAPAIARSHERRNPLLEQVVRLGIPRLQDWLALIQCPFQFEIVTSLKTSTVYHGALQPLR